MSILDLQLVLDSNRAITVTAPSTGVIDFAGVGVGNAPPNSFGISNAVFGEDVGIGDGVSPPKICVILGTAFTAGGAGTMQVQVQESVDSGAPGYTPAAWQTIMETDTLSLAQLAAGAQIVDYTIAPRAPGQAFPRFLRLNYVVATGPMTAGTIAFAGVTTGNDNAPSYPAAY
jgi:hypothetical protein